MQVDVLNIQGQKTGRSVDLPQDIFGIEPNDHVIYLAVKQYLAAGRAGTHKVKTRAEVQGSSRKLHKQKGTGGARKGNIRNPIYKGGGTIFGPKPHKYDFKINRKVKDLAKISALSYKAKEESILVIEEISIDTPKTKELVSILSNLSVAKKKTIIILSEYNESLYLSTRNVPNVTTTLLADINTYDIVNADILVFTESAVNIFSENEIIAEA